MTIMGVSVDIITRTLSIPAEKMREIVDACHEAYLKKDISKRDLQSLLGRLLYISKIIKPARGFLNRLLEGLRSMGNSSSLHINEDLRKDMLWFRTFCDSFNGHTTFANWAGHHNVEVHIDASLRGLGAVWDQAFYSVSLPTYVQHQKRIVVFEMVNILIALKTWVNLWVNKRVLVWCDNRAVVDIMGKNKTKDRELGAILREILMNQAINNIQLQVKHVRGESNPVADALSRVHMSKSVQCRAKLLAQGYREYTVPNSMFTLSMEL